MILRKATTIKPGDKINGVEVADLLRYGFDGFYFPMVDGSEVVIGRKMNVMVQCDF